MKVTTEIDTAGQVKQPIPHALHDIEVTFGSKLRIHIICNDIEDDDALLESIAPCETHLGAFLTSMVPKSSEMVSRVGNIYMYFRKGSLEDCDEPGLYVQPKTPLSLKGKCEIGETHDLERSGTETLVKQKEDHTEDDLTLHKCEHIRAATCQNLTSIAFACWRNVKDLPGYNITQHTIALRVCHLLFRAKKRKASHDKTLPEPCIKCISETFMKKQLEDGLEWAISETESLLSLPLSPQLEIHDRMASCEKELNIQPFKYEEKPLFTSDKQVIAILKVMPAFNLEEKDYGVVRETPEAQFIYVVACVLVSNHSPPENLRQDKLVKIFDPFIKHLALVE
ncbi:hypothetical protein FCOIX_5552 [Fusarium coicis]|nr:hypothetical protein FCOIX_5552 [Fusarium coicis]